MSTRRRDSTTTLRLRSALAITCGLALLRLAATADAQPADPLPSWNDGPLNRPEYRPVAGIRGAPHHTPTLALTLLLAVVGAVAFVAVILRWP